MRILCAAALLGLSSLVTAQSYTGDIYTVSTAGHLSRVTQAGVATTLADAATASDGIAVSYDNQGILWTEYGNTFSTIASVINEYRNGVNTVLFSTTDFSIEEILVNQNGEIVFTGRDQSASPVVTGVFKWVGGSSVTTLATTVAFGVSRTSLDGGMDVNINTGNYLVASAFSSPGQVWDIDDMGNVTSIVSTATTPAGGRYSMSQDKCTGNINQGGFSTYRWTDIQTGTQSAAVTPTGGTATDYYYAIKHDRASVPDASRVLYSTYQSTSTVTSGIHMVTDPEGAAPTYTTTPVTSPVSNTTTGMVFADQRNIGSMKTGAGAYTLNFNFPGEAGYQFVSGVTAAGYSPGVQLPDGRNICINPDVLTVVTVNGLAAPFYQGAGVLDANGNGTGSIAVGVDNIGVLIHIVCVTLNGGNIVTVSDPHVMKL